MAGGRGTRLFPITLATNKQLLPVYDKPMICYPIATLMAAGIREIQIISSRDYLETFKLLLGNGSDLGMEFHFEAQDDAGGIAEGLILSEDFIKKDSVALILGDNIFHGSGLGRGLRDFIEPIGASIFAYHVSNPKEYGVVEFDKDGKVLSIEEKPVKPKSNWVIPGLYFFDNTVFEKVKLIKPSSRNELEITSVLNIYKSENKLKVSVLPRGTAWLDTGSINSMNDASNYFRILEERQGNKVACLEEIAWRLNYINESQLLNLASSYGNSSYGEYLRRIVTTKAEGDWEEN